MWPPPAPLQGHSPKPHPPPVISPSNLSLSSVYNLNNTNPTQKCHHSPLISLNKKPDESRTKHYRVVNHNTTNSNKTNSLKNGTSPMNECSCCSLNSPNSHNGANVTLNSAAEHFRGHSSSPQPRKMSLLCNINDANQMLSTKQNTPNRSQTNLHCNFHDFRNLSASNSRQNVSLNGSKNIFR